MIRTISRANGRASVPASRSLCRLAGDCACGQALRRRGRGSEGGTALSGGGSASAEVGRRRFEGGSMGRLRLRGAKTGVFTVCCGIIGAAVVCVVGAKRGVFTICCRIMGAAMVL